MSFQLHFCMAEEAPIRLTLLPMTTLSSGHKSKTKTKTTTTKLCEGPGEWVKAGRYRRGVNTWKEPTTLCFCYLWLWVQRHGLLCTTGAAKTQKPTILLAWRNRSRTQGHFSWWNTKMESQKGDREEKAQILCINSVWVSGWPLNHTCIRSSPTSPVKAKSTKWDLSHHSRDRLCSWSPSKLPAKTNKQKKIHT